MSIKLVGTFSLDEISAYWGALRVPIEAQWLDVLSPIARRRIDNLMMRYSSWSDALQHVGDLGSFDAEFLYQASRALPPSQASRLDWWWTTFSKPSIGGRSEEELWLTAVSRIAWRYRRSDRKLDGLEQWRFERCEELRSSVASDLDRLTAYSERMAAEPGGSSEWDRRVGRFFTEDGARCDGLAVFISNLIVEVSVAHWWTRCSRLEAAAAVATLRSEISEELAKLARPPHHAGEPRSFAWILDESAGATS